MAIGPIDYSSMQVQPDLIGNFAKGYQLGQGIRNDQQQQQQLQQQKDLQAQYGQDLTAAMQNGSPKAMAWLVAKYPQQREAFKQSWDILSADQQKNELASAGGVYAALQSGRPDIAAQQLDQHIAALKNSGQDATQLQNLRDTIDQNPQAATAHAGFVLSSIMGPEKFTDTFVHLGSEARSEQLQPFNIAQKGAEAAQAVTTAQNAPEQQALGNKKLSADIQNIQSQISDRTGRLGLDTDKQAIDIQEKIKKLGASAPIEKDARELINKSVADSVASDQSAGQMISLANKLESNGGGYGAAGTAAEWAASATGNQDYISALRSEYARLRTQNAIKLLPPGPASDRDVSLAMKSFPSETADAKYMASFLRGMAKLQQYSAASDSAKAEWVSQNGHLGTAKEDVSVGGVQIPKGTTFNDFLSKNIDRFVSGRDKQQQESNISSRSYMKYAQGGQ